MNRLAPFVLFFALGCSETHTFHAPDIDVAPPGLGTISAWRQEAYRKDPKQVAHFELMARLDVPWKTQPYHDDSYEFHRHNPERPDWGAYVVRSYYDRSGRHRRYRVKVRQHEEIWYAVQISRFIDVEMNHPAMGDHDHDH